MTWTRTPMHTLLAAALLMALLTGCDSDSNGDEVSQEALTQMSSMMGKVQSALTTVLSQIQFTVTASKEAAPSRPARAETFDCPQGGQVLFDGNITTTEGGTSFDLSMEFDDCNGVSGDLDYAGQGSLTETAYDFSITMNGSLQEQCTLSYNNYSQEVMLDLSAGSSTVVIDGSMGVQCGGSSFTCSFDNVTYNSDGSNTGALQNSCG